LLGLSFTIPAFSQSGQPRFASLESYRGRASVVRLGNALDLQRGMALQRNDVVVTREGSLVLRFYSDGSQLRVGSNSRVQINESAGERDIEVFGGRLWARIVSWKERPARFRTGRTIAAVRGTELAIEYSEETAVVSALEGQVEVGNDDGSVMVGGGQSAVVEAGKGPQLRTIVRPQDAVQWALYFEPVLYEPPAAADATLQGTVSASADAYRGGDLEAALDAIAEIDADEVDDAGFFIYRASLQLAASNVEQADADIARALELDAGSSDALALQAVIAVAGNESNAALAAAERAVTADPQSATAQIAMSYAKQSVFDLEGVRAALEQAVALEPDNALAWARLSEVRLAFGKTGQALEAADTAAQLEPNLARTQSVLGYAYLAQVRVGRAKEAFEKAIDLDQGDPLPRLGLGLAKIRDGALKDGAKEIETAASLDPGNSLIRSYLGKAYYEMKMAGLDDREYGLAKQFDSNDPTPWFYEAIAKQTSNRPVEALRDMSQAIELNDNRGVYRSRLLLDSDLAARSASLGRIYGDLGFQSRALVEGWNSINADPGNYSAHRLLADSYAVLPRHEIARVSELYQSQMLQPNNTTAIQPSLAEANLALVSGQGPSALSFNEFNPLFNRDQVRAQITGSYAEDNTWLGEAIVSGIAGKFSFSAGYNHYETDGWRENSDQRIEIGNVFMQLEFSPKTSIQGEYRYREDELGDTTLRFFDDDFFPGERRTEERQTGRLGLRHAFSPSSILLASVQYIDSDAGFVDEDLGFFFTYFGGNRTEEGYAGEVQHIYRSRHFNLTSGIGYFDVDGSLYTRVELNPIFVPPPWNVIEETRDNSAKMTNAYLYSYINPVDRLTIVAGVSGDFIDGESPEIDEEDEVNPKLGISWQVGKGTTLRAAGFKTLRRTLVTDQTLEPTNVAGFNQLFDDLIGTRATRYGGAIDQKIGKGSFLGAELSTRDLEIPYLDIDGLSPMSEDATERLGRAYVFIAAHRMLALRFEYQYEKFESEGATDMPVRLETKRFPIGINFFAPGGFSATATGTYYDQEGRFVLIGGQRRTGADTFWTVDLSLSYRLPKRLGFLSVGVTNLLDEHFNYFEIDTRNLTIVPVRRIYGRVTLAF
jgi:ferric-dicitrate binding protein FerR (iron transport regulator)